jgi:SAM-dependent methyltransferase
VTPGFERDDIASSYDAMAEDYASLFDGELERNESDRGLLDLFIERLPALSPVYDLGCGPGHVAAYLASRGVDAVGLDLSPGMVTAARQRFPGVTFEEGDFCNPPSDRGPWAGAVAYYSLIHLERVLLAPALAAIGRVMRPGGLVLAIVHEGSGELHVDEWRGRPVNLDASHFTEAELAGALASAGFTVELSQTRPPHEWEYQRPKLQVLARRPSDEPQRS